MVSDVYYGLIKPDKLETWETNDDPYTILENPIALVGIGGWDFLDIADKLLKGETQVDWGSYAYKANYADLVMVRDRLKCEIPGLEEFDSSTEFGVVFIEGV